VSGWLGGQDPQRRGAQPGDVVARLDAITEDLVRAIRTLLRDDSISMAVVGPHRSERRSAPCSRS
jgi:hypothetical protein